MKSGLLLSVRPPEGDESLMSYLVACAAGNYVHHRHILDGNGVNGTLPSAPFRHANEVASLRKFLGIEGGRFDRMFHPPDASGGSVPLAMFNGIPLRRSFIDTTRRRISPASLRVSNHGRAAWLVSPLPFCQRSWELLTDVCLNPECGAQLRWHRLEHVAQCPRCKSDLRDFDRPLVGEHVRSRLGILADLIADDRVARDNALAVFPPEIRTLGVNGVFDLTVAMTRHGQQIWESEEEYRLARAVSALQGWPDKFIDYRFYADALPLRNRQPTFSERFVASLRSASALPAVRDFFASDNVRNIGCDIDVGKAVQLQLLRLGYFSQNEAAKYIGTSVATLVSLVEAGLLEGRRVSIRRRETMWIDRTSARAVERELAARMSLTRLSRLSGLSRLSLRSLIAGGLLKQVQSDVLDICFEEEQIDRDSAHRFLASFTNSVTDLPMNQIGWVTLQAVKRQIGGRPKPVIGFIEHAIGNPGMLAAPRKADGRLDLSRLHVRLDAITALAKLPSNFNDPTWRTNGRVCLNDACDLLNCNWVGIRTLRDHDLIPECSVNDNQIDRWAVERAARELISSQEISARMGRHFFTVDQFVFSLRVEPFCSGFWKRREIESHLDRDLSDWAVERMVAFNLSCHDVDAGLADLTDAEWDRARAWLPRRRVSSFDFDDRKALNAHIWSICLHRPLQAAPERYGDTEAISRRLSPLKRGGHMARIEGIISKVMLTAA